MKTLKTMTGNATAALAGAILGAALAVPASAGTDALTLADTVLKLSIANHPAAGYFKLSNTGDTPRVLVGAASPACGKAMLHQSKMENGVMKMVPAGVLTIAPGETLEFAPGGYHIMCMHPAEDIKANAEVPVTLKFKNGDTLDAGFTVLKAR